MKPPTPTTPTPAKEISVETELARLFDDPDVEHIADLGENDLDPPRGVPVRALCGVWFLSDGVFVPHRCDTTCKERICQECHQKNHEFLARAFR